VADIHRSRVVAAEPKEVWDVLEVDTGAWGLARRLRRTVNPPAPLRIRVPAHLASNFEALVVRVDDVPGGDGDLWKLVRTFELPQHMRTQLKHRELFPSRSEISRGPMRLVGRPQLSIAGQSSRWLQ
jgi:hypothetical protein